VLDATASTRVRAEFVGLARQFRNVVQAEDRAVDRVQNVIAAPLRDRLRHHPKLRSEQPMGVLRQYAGSMPTTLRIGRPRAHRVRHQRASHQLVLALQRHMGQR
jgi:hypothetical protein